MVSRCTSISRKIFTLSMGFCCLFGMAFADQAPGVLFRGLAYGDKAAAVMEKLQSDEAVAVDTVPPFTDAGYYVTVGSVTFLVKPLLMAGALDSAQLLSAVPISSAEYYTLMPKIIKVGEKFMDMLFGGSSVSIENALLPSDKYLAKTKAWEPLATWHGEQVVAQTGVQLIEGNYFLLIKLSYDADVSRYAELQRQEDYVSYMHKNARKKQLVEKLGKALSGGMP